MNPRLKQVEKWPELALQAKWSVSILSKQCGVSLRTLERFFLKEMGKTPKAWLVEQRQRQAINMVNHGSTVKETAYSLGYKHVTHFSRDFKDYWGQSPSARSAQIQ